MCLVIALLNLCNFFNFLSHTWIVQTIKSMFDCSSVHLTVPTNYLESPAWQPSVITEIIPPALVFTHRQSVPTGSVVSAQPLLRFVITQPSRILSVLINDCHAKGQYVQIFMSNDQGPFYKLWLALVSRWISNHMPGKVWNEINYPFPYLHGCTTEVWKWVSIVFLHFIMDMITYLPWD